MLPALSSASELPGIPEVTENDGLAAFAGTARIWFVAVSAMSRLPAASTATAWGVAAAVETVVRAKVWPSMRTILYWSWLASLACATSPTETQRVPFQ